MKGSKDLCENDGIVKHILLILKHLLLYIITRLKNGIVLSIARQLEEFDIASSLKDL